MGLFASFRRGSFACAVLVSLELLISAPPLLFAQAARKDATAIGTVAQTLAATGWIAPPNVIVASGTVTRFVSDDDPTLQVTLTFPN